MKNYWLRIALGALAVFAVGMILVNVFNIGRDRVVRVVKSDSPITIPLAFIPFKLDGREYGTLSRLEILRSSPEDVEALNFRVKLADSVNDDMLATCVIVAGGDLQHAKANHTFSCATDADTVGKPLEAIGQIETQSGRTFVLLAKEGTLQDYHLNLDVDNQADSVSARYAAMADSIQQAAESIEHAADSVRAIGEAQADSIRNAAREQGRRMSDSIRREVRERMAELREAQRSAQPKPAP